MQQTIERIVAQLGLKDRVKLVGFVTAVERIWAENHVLVMPSRYEGLPLAMVEAMLCARPVVATDVAGHSEILEDGASGFLAESATVHSMASALERLWTNRTELEMMGQVAAVSIRKYVPREPARVFADKIKAVVGQGIGKPDLTGQE